MKKIIFPLLMLAFGANAQMKYLEMSNDSNANFYDIKREFENYWKDRPYTRGSGYNVFRRWADYMEPRVYPTGNMRGVGRSRALEELRKHEAEMAQNKLIHNNAAPTSTTASWIALGPFGSATNTGAGRLQCVRFMPGSPTTIFCGAAAGGLWKSTDNGATWTTNTDQLASLGVADIAIDPTNTNLMYIATGDLDGSGTGFSFGDTKSTGVLKSTDGGATWNTTSLSWTTSQQRFIAKLLINPINTGEIFAFTSVGIYRTRDAATTWTLVQGGNYKDAEYKPGDTTTIYAANGATLQRSTNGGQSFSNTTFPSSGLNRIAIAVTAADPNYVYVLGSKSSNSCFGGLWQSTNSATSFSLMSSTPNVLDGTATGSSTSAGQGWYDLAIGASPTNKNEITVGGVNTWKSTNGGSTWTLNTCWNNAVCGSGPAYNHADQHDIVYQNGTTNYLCNDGGLGRTTNSGVSYSTINGSMNISEPYFLGCSATSASLIVAGLQDNGTVLWNGTTWNRIYSGDGMDCFIDWNNNNVIVASYVNGAFAKSTNGGASWSNIVTGLTGTGNWVAPIVQDPNTASIFYCGYQEVFRSPNQGNSWTQLGTLGGSGDVMVIEPCPSNTNVMYVARATQLFKTTNGGTTWTNITGTLPVGSAQIKDIAVDNTDENKVYITFSGYVANTKVYYSIDGGSTWTNYSTGLPNIPADCIIFTKNSPGAIYVGTDVGVYYRELSMSSFIPYYTGLPNVWVNDLQIYYPTRKLRAATFGRGIWETDLYLNVAPPNAYFTSNYSAVCVGGSISFNDASANYPTSWSWSFPGGSPATSTAQNPTSITYATAGVYTVSLVATNSVGVSSPYTMTVNIVNTPTSVPTTTGTCAGQPVNVMVATNAASVTWQGGQNGTTATYAPTVTSVYSYTVYTGACSSTGTATINVGTPPPTPTVTGAGNILSTGSASSYQWYLNGTPIPGATGQTYDASLTGSGWYSVWVGNGSGCESSSTSTYITVTGINELPELAGIEVTPNPAKDHLEIIFKSNSGRDVTYVILNSLGQEVKQGNTKAQAGSSRVELEGLSDGVYTLVLSSNNAMLKYKFVKN